MSINLGMYDFFSFFIPGLLYLYAFNEFLGSVGWKYIDINSWIQSGQTPSIVFLIPLVIGAYIIGHLVDPIAQNFFNLIPRFGDREPIKAESLKSVKDRYTNLDIQFEPRDWNVLFALIRQRNIEMARVLDKFSADSIMLRNIAFGLFVLSITNVVSFFSSGKWEFLVTATIILVLCLLSISNSVQFRKWFFKDIFRASLDYGVSIEEIVGFSKNKIGDKETKSKNKKRIISK